MIDWETARLTVPTDMPRKTTRRPSATALCLSAIALTLAGGPAAARDYEVEIIVFDRLNRDIAVHEQWNFSSARTAARLDEMQELAAKASTRRTSEQLAGLEAVRLKLVESNYRILDTARWRQPATFYPNAPLIPLGGPGSALAAGFIRVYRTSLIYADLNLQLSPPVPDAQDAQAAAWPPHYFIAEKRRLKFKQIHYFDHPLFGAILRVWPVNAAAVQADDQGVDRPAPP